LKVFSYRKVYRKFHKFNTSFATVVIYNNFLKIVFEKIASIFLYPLLMSS
jgi:hypothetical protein